MAETYYKIAKSTLTEIADTIRKQTKESGKIPLSSMKSKMTLQEKTATPTAAEQTIEPDAGQYGLSKVTISAIESAKVTGVDVSSDGDFSVEFEDETTASGSVTFSTSGLPTSLTDNKGNTITFSGGWPTGLTNSDGHTVTITGG